MALVRPRHGDARWRRGAGLRHRRHQRRRPGRGDGRPPREAGPRRRRRDARRRPALLQAEGLRLARRAGRAAAGRCVAGAARRRDRRHRRRQRQRPERTAGRALGHGIAGAGTLRMGEPALRARPPGWTPPRQRVHLRHRPCARRPPCTRAGAALPGLGIGGAGLPAALQRAAAGWRKAACAPRARR